MTITFEVTCVDVSTRAPQHAMGKSRWDFGNREYNRPVVSYDKKNWHEVEFIEKVKIMAGLTYRFRHTFEEEEAYLCYNYPYTSTDLKKYLEKINKDSRVRIDSLGKTHNGTEQLFLNITGNEKSKNLILLIFREDADEINTSFIAEGLTDYLLNVKNPRVKRVLDNCVFKIIPMVSLEGVISGAPYSAGYGVLSCKWNESPSPPEIQNIKDALEGWVNEGNRLILAGKFCGDGANISIRSMGGIKTGDSNLGDTLISSLDANWKPIQRLWNDPDHARNTVSEQGFFERYLLKKYGFIHSFCANATEPGAERIRECGGYFAEAILEYLDKRIF